jgi:hypothetical protein
MARIATVGPAVPSEAKSQGNLNETVPAEQRKPEGSKLGEGPVKTEQGAYKPASYKVPSGAIRTDR